MTRVSDCPQCQGQGFFIRQLFCEEHLANINKHRPKNTAKKRNVSSRTLCPLCKGLKTVPATLASKYQEDAAMAYEKDLREKRTEQSENPGLRTDMPKLNGLG